MKAEHFCFWLQGHFELNPDQNVLDVEQTTLVKRHLALVFAHETDVMASRAGQFCIGLNVFFKMSPDLESVDSKRVRIIKKDLGDVFKHEIDPSMGSKDHQNKLNNIHNVPYRPDRPGDFTLRC